MKILTKPISIFLIGLFCNVGSAFAEATSKDSGQSGGKTVDAQSADWDPFRELDQMRHTMDRMFQDVMTRGISDQESSATFSFAPAMDLQKTDTDYILTVDLPGVEKDKVSVQVQNNMLTVSGERETEKRQRDRDYYRMERDFGSFSRTISLPTDASSENITADSKNGVLTIKIPRSPQAPSEKARTIKVQ
jgi:HSP20 family protein